jgi:ribonuclease T2
MPSGKLARYVVFAALIGITVLSYIYEENTGVNDVPAQHSPDAPAEADGRDKFAPTSSTGFDFYVLALSWSPSYCAAEGANANRQQCSSGRPYGFVVHGLWPQFETGYPQNCETSQSRNVPFAQAKQLSDIMPSPGLVTHEWRKHGSCTGLTQKDYFSLVRQAVKRVAIPPAYRQPTPRAPVNPQLLEQAFVSANPGLSTEGIAVTCDRDYLREVRVCLTKELTFRPCPEVDRSSCRRRSVEMPAAQ